MPNATFRRAVVRTPAGPDSIVIVEQPLPIPGPGELVVQIAGAAVNPVDVGVASGRFHALGLIHQPHCTGLGWDFAGTVSDTGAGTDLPRGARVAGFIDGFDRDHGSHATHLVVDAGLVARVPDDVDLPVAGAVPLNAVAAAQLVDRLGDPPDQTARLLVTGAAGALGANVAVLARDRGWQVTGVARPADDGFVRSLGADFTTRPEAGWDAVADAAAMHDDAFELVRDGGTFVGVQPANVPLSRRGIHVDVLVARPDGERLAGLLARVATGELPARVQAAVPLERVADAYRAMEAGGVRGRIVITP